MIDLAFTALNALIVAAIVAFAAALVIEFAKACIADYKNGPVAGASAPGQQRDGGPTDA